MAENSTVARILTDNSGFKFSTKTFGTQTYQPDTQDYWVELGQAIGVSGDPGLQPKLHLKIGERDVYANLVLDQGQESNFLHSLHFEYALQPNDAGTVSLLGIEGSATLADGSGSAANLDIGNAANSADAYVYPVIERVLSDGTVSGSGDNRFIMLDSNTISALPNLPAEALGGERTAVGISVPGAATDILSSVKHLEGGAYLGQDIMLGTTKVASVVKAADGSFALKQGAAESAVPALIEDLVFVLADGTGQPVVDSEPLAVSLKLREFTEALRPNDIAVRGTLMPDTIDLSDDAPAKSASDVVQIRSGAGADTVTGHDGADWIDAGSGNDMVWALGGDDVIVFGSGVDIVDAGFGNDTIRLFDELESSPVVQTVLDAAGVLHVNAEVSTGVPGVQPAYVEAYRISKDASVADTYKIEQIGAGGRIVLNTSMQVTGAEQIDGFNGTPILLKPGTPFAGDSGTMAAGAGSRLVDANSDSWWDELWIDLGESGLTLGATGKLVLERNVDYRREILAAELSIVGNYLHVPLDIGVLSTGYYTSFMHVETLGGLLVGTNGPLSDQHLAWRVQVGQTDAALTEMAFITGTAGADTYVGTAGDEWYRASAGNDSVSVGAGNDVVQGGDGNDSLDGGAGNDLLIGGFGDDILAGGDGSGDVAAYSGYRASDMEIVRGNDGAITVRNIATGELDHLTGIEILRFDDGEQRMAPVFTGADSRNQWISNNISGTDYAEVIDADALGLAAGATTTREWIDAGGGNDKVDAGAGGDDIRGGAGDDILDGGDDTVAARLDPAVTNPWELENRANYSGPADRYSIERRNDDATGSVTGEAGATYYTVRDLSDGSPEGIDTVFNVDFLQFNDKQVRLIPNVSLNRDWDPQTGQFGPVRGINVTGTDFGESLGTTGSALATHFTGQNWIDAGGGNDWVDAGDGGDWIQGGAGDDIIDGGNDTVAARLNPDLTNPGELENRAGYSGATIDYSVARNTDDASGSVTGEAGKTYYTVLDLRDGSPDGTDMVFNIDALQFSDKQVRLTPEIWMNRPWDPQTQQPGAINGIGVRGTDFGESLGATGSILPTTFPGQDWIEAGGGNDRVDGGEGGDNISGGAGDDILDGGNDTVAARLNPDLTNPGELENRAGYSGLAGDYSIARKIDDASGSVTGEAGKTYYTVRDLRDGSPDGTDTVFNIDALNFSDRQVRLTPGIWMNREWDPQTQQFGAVRGINVTGTDFSESLGATGSILPTTFPGQDWIDAGGGNDRVDGGEGGDNISGGAGDDILNGGNDTTSARLNPDATNPWELQNQANYSGPANSYSIEQKTDDASGSITGEAGKTYYTVLDLREDSPDGTDTVFNIDILQFNDKQVRLTPNIWLNREWDPQTQQFGAVRGINVTGTDFGDSLGTTGSSLATSFTGQDWIDAGGGDDRVDAGDGGDWIQGGAGDDLLDGGNDSVAARLGPDVANPWELENRANYSGPAKRYSIQRTSDDASGSITGEAGKTYYTVRDLREDSPDGTDTVFNIDALQFSDKQVRLSPEIWMNRGWDPQTNLPDAVLGINVTGTDFADHLGATDDTLATTFAGSDRLVGNAGNDIIKGGAGADTLRGDAGNDILDGGGNRPADSTQQWDPNGSNGVDAAEYSGKAERYTIIRNDDGSYSLTDLKLRGGDGTDTLTTIEVLRFADGEKNLEVISSPMLQWSADPVTGESSATVTGMNWRGTDWTDSVDATVGESETGWRDDVDTGAGNDSIKTGKGGDYIRPGEGDDTVDGGANGTSSDTWNNNDIVYYDAPMRRFAITMAEDADGLRTFTVKDRLAAEFYGLGTDILTNVERLDFTDGSKDLQVSLNLGSRFDIGGTDFGDRIDTDALAANSAKPNTISLTIGVQSILDIALASVPDGEQFVAVLGSTQPMPGGQPTSFEAATTWDDATQSPLPIEVSLARAANGHLTGSYLITTRADLRPYQDYAFQVYAVDANGAQTGTSLGQFAVSVVSNWNNIRANAGDDVVYAGADGDYMTDGAGDDFYDGGANGSSAWSWENQDVVQFMGAQKRYKVELLAYAQLDDTTKAKIDAKYDASTRPATIVKVSDKLPATSGGDGVNYLINVERIQFQDGEVDLGVTTDLAPNFDDWSANSIRGGLLNDTLDGDALIAASTTPKTATKSVSIAWATGQTEHALSAQEFIAAGQLQSVKFTSLTDTNVELMHGGVTLQPTADSPVTIAAANLAEYQLQWTGPGVPYSSPIQAEVTGYTYRDSMDGGPGNDTLLGGAGGDWLNGGKGDDLIDGGDNVAFDPTQPWNTGTKFDEAHFNNSIKRYDINFYREKVTGETGTHDANGLAAGPMDYVQSAYYDPNGFIVVQDRYSAAQGGEGRDVLKNVEILTFSDAWEQLKLNYSDNTQEQSNWDPATQQYVPQQVTTRNVWASRFGDRIEGLADGQNYLQGNAGNDRVTGGNLRDELTGGLGDDIIDGGANPVVDPAQPWNIWDKYDVARFEAARAEFDVQRLTDSDGTKTGTSGQVYYRVEHLIPATLGGGLGTDIVFNIERLQFSDGDEQLLTKIEQYGDFARYEGSNFDDTIAGTSGNENFTGRGGDDNIDADGGNDYIDAGGGNDTINAGDGDDQIANLNTGDDTVDGGAGTDAVRYEDAYARYIVITTNGVTTITDKLGIDYGGDGTDTLSNVESINFTDGTMDPATGTFVSFGTNTDPLILTVDAFNSSLNGGAGNDSLTGDGLNNTLNGGAGDDTLAGGAGDDMLNGGAGDDVLDGGDDSSDDRNNYWNAGDVVYVGAVRGRFDIALDSTSAEGVRTYRITDLASVNNLTADSFGADGHLNAPALLDLNAGVGYGSDLVTNIERLQFSDAMLDLTPRTNSWTWQSSWHDNNTGQDVTYDVTRTNVAGTFQNDTLIGTTHGDEFDGKAGDDIIDGGIETETVGNPWEIQDVVRYSGTRERYVVDGVLVNPVTYAIVDPLNTTGNEVAGIQITDVLPAGAGGSGTDLLVNIERVEFNGSQLNVKPEISSWFDSYSNTTNINARGTDFSDTLNGGGGNDWMSGNAGDDTLVGGAGGDDLEGGAGDDVLIGGDDAAVDQWGWTRTDTARFNAAFDRFTIDTVTLDGESWLRVADLLPSDDVSSFGTDLLSGVESLGFNDRWIDVAVRTNSWTDWQGSKTVNHEGTVFGDVMEGYITTTDGIAVADRDSMRGNAGDDVLKGGGNGDELQGGEGNDVLDGGANGSSGDAWRDQDTARFSGDASRYDIQSFSVTENSWANGQVLLDGVLVATAGLHANVQAVIARAHANLDFFDGGHNIAYLVADTLDADLGGDGADLVFNVESLWFANGPLELDIRANANDWDGDGKLDWVNATGTANGDHVNLARIATLTGKSEELLTQTRIDIELREGDDLYVGGGGGESVRTGAGNDYVDGGANSGIDQWAGAMRDEVHFEGKFSRYTLIDVTLDKSGDTWSVASAKDATLSYSGSVGASTVTSTDLGIVKLETAAMAQAIDSMIANAATGATQVKGWLVADRLPAEFEGTGVDAIVNVEAISFSDKWMPLDVQVYYQRQWDPEHPEKAWNELPISSAYVDGTRLGDIIGYSAAAVVADPNVDYNYAGDDSLRGNEGDDVISGGAGGDWIHGGAGNDSIDGGDDGVDQWGNARTDTAQYDGDYERYAITANADGSVTVTDSESDGDGSDTLTNVEALSFRDRYLRLGIDTWVNRDYSDSNKIYDVSVTGSLLPDTIDVSADAYPGIRHFIRGAEGDDTLTGGAGPDEFEGGAGDDTLVGGANGKDAWGNPGFDTARYDGMAERYTIEFSADGGATWSETNPGGSDLQVSSIIGSRQSVAMVRVTDSWSVDDGGVGVDILSGIEAIGFWDRFIMLEVTKRVIDLDGDGRPDSSEMKGTDSTDTMTGDATSDRLDGGDGSDKLEGGRGGDILMGGAGDNILDGGENGVDRQGNALVDIAEYSGKASDYAVTRNPDGSFTVTSTTAGTDTLTDIEGLQFSDGFLVLAEERKELDLNGDGSVDVIEIRGTDTLDDSITPNANEIGVSFRIAGGKGNDTLTGGAENDRFEGGPGNDTIGGGDGTADRAHYSGNSADYAIATAGGETIVTHNIGGADGTDILTGIEQLVFADKVVWVDSQAATITTVEVDTDGNKKADTAYITGTDSADTVTGSLDLVNIVTSGAGNDILTGGNLGDEFAPGTGNDTIDGGANTGLDTAGNPALDRVIYDGAQSGYSVATKQEATFSFRGTVEAGDVFSVTIGSTKISYTATGTTMDSVAAGLETALTNAGLTGITTDSVVTSGEAIFTVTGTDVIPSVTPSVANGKYTLSGSFVVNGGNQSGTSLTLDVVSGLKAGMYIAYGVTTGTGTNAVTANYGPYQISSISGTTLTLAESMGAAPANDAILTATADNADTSGRASDVTYERWFEVGKSGETDVLRNVEELVFGDGVMSLTSATSEKAQWGAQGLETVLKVDGTDLPDILRATAATEIFSGGAGADHFVFADANGKDQIRRFTAGNSGDVLTFVLGASDTDGINGSGVDTVTEMLARASQQGSDTVIDLGAGNVITLVGVAASDLGAANFEVLPAF